MRDAGRPTARHRSLAGRVLARSEGGAANACLRSAR
jgi:hypothetical protein